MYRESIQVVVAPLKNNKGADLRNSHMLGLLDPKRVLTNLQGCQEDGPALRTLKNYCVSLRGTQQVTTIVRIPSGFA